jgi:hypothetical protein
MTARDILPSHRRRKSEALRTPVLSNVGGSLGTVLLIDLIVLLLQQRSRD